MAKCVITFSDKAENGEIDISVEFDPDMSNPLKGHTPTPAQNMGWQFAQAILSDAGLDD